MRYGRAQQRAVRAVGGNLVQRRKQLEGPHLAHTCLLPGARNAAWAAARGLPASLGQVPGPMEGGSQSRPSCRAGAWTEHLCGELQEEKPAKRSKMSKVGRWPASLGPSKGRRGWAHLNPYPQCTPPYCTGGSAALLAAGIPRHLAPGTQMFPVASRQSSPLCAAFLPQPAVQGVCRLGG